MEKPLLVTAPLLLCVENGNLMRGSGNLVKKLKNGYEVFNEDGHYLTFVDKKTGKNQEEHLFMEKRGFRS